MGVKALRILVVCGSSGWGGLESYATTQAADLAARGHHIDFACRPHSPMEKALLERSLRTLPIAPSSSGDLLSAVRLARTLRQGQYHLLHSHFSRDYIPAVFAARLARKPVVLTRHVLFTMSRPTTRAAARANRIISVSYAVRNVLVERLKIPSHLVTTVWTGIDLNRFVPLEGPPRMLPALGLPADARVFGMITRLLPGKRCDTFLKAAAMVKQAHPEARYLLIGDGPYRPAIESLVKELSLGAEVMLLGFREDVHLLLPELTASVLASDGEAFSYTILEAMACGIPVIASRLGGNPEAIVEGETGFLFELGDEAGLARAMILLAENPKQAHQMGQAGRRRARANFERSMMLEQVEKIYREVLEG